ncbi:MAG: acyltransferase family protein [Bacteroidales bacterium]|nr:acyltransferase family protein [Bacteroidales bacterium]
MRNHALDLLRILACLAVITIHTSGVPIMRNLLEVGSAEYIECLILNALCHWSVPVFVMLTGYFMLDSSKDLTIKRLFTKNILRLVVSLFFWSALYALYYNKNLFPLGSQEGHLWYVGMIIGVYLAIPILRLISKNFLILRYFSWTWVAFMCYNFCGNFVELPIEFQDTIFVDYVGYALFAYYIKSLLYCDQGDMTCRRISVIIYIVGLFGLFFMLVPLILTMDSETPFVGYTSPGVIAVSVAVFTYFVRQPINFSEKVGKLIENCSNCAYGIYLVHIWFLVQVFNRLHRYIQQPLIHILICVLIAFVGGYCVTFIIKKIPILKKFVV